MRRRPNSRMRRFGCVNPVVDWLLLRICVSSFYCCISEYLSVSFRLASFGKMLGKTVAHYRILEKIGGGGMGVVYKAEDIRLGRLVALKFLPDEFASDPRILERFRREARAISVLNHPNICTLHDIGEAEGRTFLVMELLEGRNLREIIKEHGALPLNRLVRIATDIAEALEAAHEKGILHRDIKPANILVTHRGTSKLLDFGLAKSGELRQVVPVSAEDITVTNLSGGWALGTIGYMSPEQALGKPLDERTDLFSFGAVLYEMATGEAPFHGDSTGAIFISVVKEKEIPVVQFRADLPELLQQIIGRCLEKERENRYRNATEVLHDLQQLQRELEGSAIPGVVTDQFPPVSVNLEEDSLKAEISPIPSSLRERTSRALIAAAVVVVAIALGVFAFIKFRLPTARPTNKNTVVLADFTNTTGESVFDETLKQAARLDLEQSPYLNVLSDRQVGETLKQMSRPSDQRLTREVAREICLRTNSAVLIVGSISHAGDRYSLALNASSCEDKAVLASVTAESADRSSIPTALHRADEQLRQDLGESLPSLQKFNSPLAEATTSSLEALKLYSVGLKERQTKGSLAGIPHMLRATEIDPTFAQAYARLGSMYFNTSQWGPARDSYQRAYELRGRVSQRERFYIEYSYFQNVSGEFDKAILVCQDWSRSYPGDSYPHSVMGLIHLNLGQIEKAAQEFLESLRLGTDTPYSNLMAAYMRLGRLDEAKAMFDAARSHDRDSDYLRLNRYTLGFLERDERAMQGEIEWSKGKAGYEDTLLKARSDVEAYWGRLAKARELERQAKSAAVALGAKDRAADYDADSALREAEMGNLTLTRQCADEALAVSDAVSVRERVAVALARAGEIRDAEKLAEQLNAQYPRNTLLQSYALPTIRALILMRKNQPAKAIEILQPVLACEYGQEGFGSLLPAYVRGLVYLQLGNGPQAAAEFEKLIAHPGLVGLSVTGALAGLQLARAEELSGDHEAARRHYQDFLALWKDADPDVPIFKQAKAEYAVY